MATGVALKILGEQEQMDEDYFSSKRSLSCLPICKANLDTIVGGFVKRANVIVKVPSNKRVLIRGCASKMIPPWVYMFFVGKLADLSKLVYYGSEEDKIVVYPIKSSVRT